MRRQLNAQPIEARTKGALKRLRREGNIPISIQHRGQETLHYQEEAKPLEDFLHQHGESTLLDLRLEPEGATKTVMVHDIQRDAITGRLLQVTFQSVEKNEPVKAHIPLVFRGEPQAVREHTAMVQHALESIDIRCLPGNLVEYIAVDIGSLHFGESLRVSDLPNSDRYEILTPADTVIASVVTLRASVEETETSAPATEGVEATAAAAV